MYWTNREGYQWNWQHDTRSWVEGKWGNVETIEPEENLVLTTDQISNLTTAQLV
jgi:hypothetical protein